MNHDVTNQPTELLDYNVFSTDPLLPGLLQRILPNTDQSDLVSLGDVAGSTQFYQDGFAANDNEPVLHTHDRFGHRIDEVRFHPAWHSLLNTAVAAGNTSMPFEPGAPAGAHVLRSVSAYLTYQIEQGHGCPVAMTYAAIPVLQRHTDLFAAWQNKLMSRIYDPAFAPIDTKAGVLIGMGMTEKQGGSDVRSNSTVATEVAEHGAGPGFLLDGHKWFFSAPMCDAFLVLAQAPRGLSCFLVPRWTADGKLNTICLQRLKDKLGNRSNASSEVEFEQTWGQLIGEQGRGIATIIEMVNSTRLDCVIGAAATMRQAVTRAFWHCAHRSAFGQPLVKQALMVNVLADLELDVQAATMLMVRTAMCFDNADDEHQQRLKRLLTPVSKYWVTKMCSSVVREALECHGGAGFVEESILPRLFRESPLNSVWEGSGNVIALDALRAIDRDPGVIDAYVDEIASLSKRRNLAQRLASVRAQCNEPVAQTQARHLVEELAVLMAAAMLDQYAEPVIADAFFYSRIERTQRHLHGTLPAEVDAATIVNGVLGHFEL